MCKRKDLTTAEKQKVRRFLSEGISTLDISNKLWWDHQMIKKVVENISKLRTQSKGKGFKNLLLWDEWKLIWFIGKQPLLTSAQIF